MNLKKTLSAAVAAAGLVVAATSAQAAITVDVYGDYGNYFEDFKKDITRKAGSYKHNANDWGGHHNKLTLNLATGSGAADMVLVDTGMIGGYINGGGLMDLSDKFAPFEKDMVDFAVKQGQNEKGQQIGVPVDLGPGVAFFRRDYMEDIGYDVDEVMETWESWLAYGRELRDDYGVYLVSNADGIARSIIYGTVKEGNGIYTGPNNEILIENDRFKFAFNMAKQLREEGLDANTGMWNDDWYGGFREGTFAMEIQGAWMLGHLQGWIAPDTEGSWGASNLPNGIYGTWGGTFAAIPTQSKDVESAWNVIEYMISPKAQLAAFDEWAMFPANKTVHDDEMFNEGIDFLRGQDARVLFAEIANNVNPVQPGAYDNIAETLVVNTALQEVLADGRDVNEALKDAAQQLQKRMR
ncbi:MAG: extracellular solute-binding protein [Saccharospirillaceae bacterium]|nr:extracellular solute-binding protein [Pseudomonadales bacterium]NRB78589.1 extracellular solute-binding protein [Saccharospirillaceae bacterium]